MEWLKTILEKAVITDGKLYVDATMKEINAEFPKQAVPKQGYNDKVKELNTANDTIKDLKKDNADNADLQKKVEDYELEVANLKTAAANTKKEYALKDKLREAGATDADYIIYKQGGLDKFTFNKDGEVIGLDDVLKFNKSWNRNLRTCSRLQAVQNIIRQAEETRRRSTRLQKTHST